MKQAIKHMSTCALTGALLHREQLLDAHPAGQRAVRHRDGSLRGGHAAGRLLGREFFYSLGHASDDLSAEQQYGTGMR